MAENPGRLTRIIIKGFKSIQECELELKPLNILIGANGAGKSNFVQFFKFLRDVFEGKAHFQRKTTQELASWLEDYSLGELWEKNLLGEKLVA